jgi:cob(I)alamin adenosyltransferase
MSIVTGLGDDGKSSLFGGERVSKNHPRLDAYGTIDEAQSAIGMVRALIEKNESSADIDSLLARIQGELFIVGADLASSNPKLPVPRVTSEMIQELQKECDQLEKSLPVLKNFIIPAGTQAATTCFWARTVVRRAERLVARLMDKGENAGAVLVYLNRLGDLLFLVSRAFNKIHEFPEEEWSGKK